VPGAFLRPYLNWLVAVFAKTSWEGAQTTLHTALSHDVPQHNGAYYADCVPTATKDGLGENDAVMNALWQHSRRMLSQAGFSVQV
jgi:hypothetical protein